MLIFTTIAFMLITNMLLGSCDYSIISPKCIKYVKNYKLVINDDQNMMPISSIDPELFKRYNDVIVLEISNTALSEFPPGLEVMNKLRKVVFTNNKHSKNFKHLFNLTIKIKKNINELDLASMDLKEIPAEIFTFKNLRELKLNKNQLEIIPESIVQLSKLEILDLTFNNIKTLPDYLGCLQNLTELSVTNNLISEFPLSFLKLKNLRKSYTSGNELKTMPLSVCFLPNLDCFSLAGNKELKSLFPTDDELEVFLNKIQNNNELNTQIDVKTNIWSQYMPNLNLLNCTNCSLYEIPEKISLFKKLTWCKLNNNHISKVSTKIFKLIALKTLNLSKNRITAIPYMLDMDITRNMQALNFDIQENFIQNDDGTDGYGTESLQRIFSEINTDTQFPPVSTYEEAVDWYHTHNTPHWQIDKLKEVKDHSEIIAQKVSHITDRTMQIMWGLVLQHFIYKTTYIEPVSDIDKMDLEIHRLLRKVQMSKVFKSLQDPDNSPESELNKKKVHRFTEYLDKLSNTENDSREAKIEKQIIKNSIKMIFKQILKDLLEIDTEGDQKEVNKIKERINSLCLINKQDEYITEQIEYVIYLYLKYCKTTKSDFRNVVKSLILEKIATIKHGKFVETIILHENQLTCFVAEWKKIFETRLGIPQTIDDDNAKFAQTEDEIELIKVFFKFIKEFSIEYVAKKITNDINLSSILVE